MRARLSDGRECRFYWRYAHPKWGVTYTECVIQPNAASIECYVRVARCCELDQFNKETGRKLSLARAMKRAGLSKADRACVWSAYLNRKQGKEVIHETTQLTGSNE
jgi:hypothetical protein